MTDLKTRILILTCYCLNSDRPPQKGIDFWLLSRRDKSWKVVSVTNEIIPPGQEIPGMFED